MVEFPNETLINDLKKELNISIAKNKFNLTHPQVLDLSLQINSLLTPFFKQQLKNNKVIKFPN